MTHMVHVSCVTVGNSRRLQLAGQVAGIGGRGLEKVIQTQMGRSHYF
jgi:hypothetical protein